MKSQNNRKQDVLLISTRISVTKYALGRAMRLMRNGGLLCDMLERTVF